MAERTRGARQAGHICHGCGEPIPVEEMLIAVVSITWSVGRDDLPQMVRHLKHHEACAQAYIRKQQEDQLHD